LLALLDAFLAVGRKKPICHLARPINVGASRRARVLQRSFGILCDAEMSPHSRSGFRSQPQHPTICCAPICCWMLRHFSVDDFSVGMPNHEEDEKRLGQTVRTEKKAQTQISDAWRFRSSRQSGLGARLCPAPGRDLPRRRPSRNNGRSPVQSTRRVSKILSMVMILSCHLEATYDMLVARSWGISLFV
jgi:hypothetical protein